VGSIAECYRSYPHIGPVLPALGYSPQQRAELEQTIRASGAEVVVDASPARLSRCIDIGVPATRVSYEFQQVSGEPLERIVMRFLEEYQSGGAP
jgi:predicted GTPase